MTGSVSRDGRLTTIGLYYYYYYYYSGIVYPILFLCVCVRVCVIGTRVMCYLKKKSIYFYIFYSVFKTKYRSERRKTDVCPCTSVCILHGSCWRTVITYPRAVAAGMRQTISYIIHALTIVSPPRCLPGRLHAFRVSFSFVSYFPSPPPPLTRCSLGHCGRRVRRPETDTQSAVCTRRIYFYIFIFNNSNSS